MGGRNILPRWCTLHWKLLVCVMRMTKKNKPEIKLGATVRLKAQSGEIIEGRVVHLWDEKSVSMVRVASGDLGPGVQRSGEYADR